jgi:hypothetical protein
LIASCSHINFLAITVCYHLDSNKLSKYKRFANAQVKI